MDSVSILIPAYNEKELLESTVLEALECMSRLAIPHEFIIIDDGSTDGTARIADILAAQNKNINVVHHSSNRGIGAALISGFQHARSDLIFSFLPADGQLDPRVIASYYKAIGDADIVTSIRSNPAKRRLYRRLLTGGMRIFLFLLFGPTPSLQLSCLFRREILNKIRISSNTHMANPELIIKANRAPYRFKEIGVDIRPRTMGKSKVTHISKIILVMIEMIKLRFSDDYRSLKAVH
jgi:glycosyltransferase involved in cell wall biosynthesis